MPSFKLDNKTLLQIHDTMVKSRTLEERLIKMYKQNDGFFWIGGPGEEAFNIPLGMLLKKGHGPEFDYFHGHYRSGAVLLAMGAEPLDAIRQMKNTATDPYSGGRNFINHASLSKWNVVPISSPIEVQYSMAPGTAIANKRAGNGITVVIGGDAGTAEGDFATCLVWSSRPANPLPMLMIVTNNKWGISTESAPQHGDRQIADRGKAFGMKTMVINGLDPEESYLQLKETIEYVRKNKTPVLMEVTVTRLYGHSSASGANFAQDEKDPVKIFEEKLIAGKIITKEKVDEIWKKYSEMMLGFAQQVRDEPQPEGKTIWDNIFHEQKGFSSLVAPESTLASQSSLVERGH